MYRQRGVGCSGCEQRSPGCKGRRRTEDVEADPADDRHKEEREDAQSAVARGCRNLLRGVSALGGEEARETHARTNRDALRHVVELVLRRACSRKGMKIGRRAATNEVPDECSQTAGLPHV